MTMTNNPTIDGVSRDAFKWAIQQLEEDGHRGCGYFDSLSALLDTPSNALREHCKQCAEVVKTWPEWKQNCLGGAPVVERQPNVIDLDAANWENIQKAADESSWMPNEYMRNEWVSDVCNFLKYGRAEHPAPPEVAALQSTIAQLQARVAELESARGEPTIEHVASIVEGKTVSVDVSTGDDDAGNRLFCQIVEVMEDGDSYVLLAVDPVANFEAAPPAPVAVVLPERKPDINRSFEGTDAEWYGNIAWNACLDATAALNEVRK